ncbi:MAG: sulfatase-like hydrolase/transferase [Myxococcota bacterium]|nr:sulfatase-like hydrolase/transferase [Myxococcota bacterium]MDW8361527.1 sulfatase-like hydrolase/transferase [Myxococcales bacterium]
MRHARAWEHAEGSFSPLRVRTAAGLRPSRLEMLRELDRFARAGYPVRVVGEPERKRTLRRAIVIAIKLAFTVTVLVLIYRSVLGREGAAALLERLGSIRWPWLVAAVGIQLLGVGFSLVRWQRLLVGQGIHAPWRFLAGSILIARFWGAFTPGGFTGFGGWRIYDVARHTGKTARAAVVIGVETILGQLAFGLCVMIGSLWGLSTIGWSGVLLLNGLFALAVTVGLLLLVRPGLIRRIAGALPPAVSTRLRTAVDAVCAYQGRGKLLVQAALLGVGTHSCHFGVYVAAAHALGADLGVGQVFFASALQVLAALVPASINGIGLREAAAVAIYERLGVPGTIALLIPTLGFACEMVVSALGGPIFLARRAGYRPSIRVDDPDRERLAHAAIERVPPAQRPRLVRATVLAACGGLLGGLLVGVAEGAVVLAADAGSPRLWVLGYGAIVYGIFGALAAGVGGLVLAAVGRWMGRRAVPEARAYARWAAGTFALLAFALGAFRIRRDAFDEMLVWKSAMGLGVLAVCALCAVLLYAGLAAALRVLLERRPFGWMLRAWGSPAFGAFVVASAAVGSAFVGSDAEARPALRERPAAPPQARNVLFIVVDTLRADHLPVYGYARGRTPHLDAFARDAVRFEQFFVNASWTRPSFASLLTGRLPTNHAVMDKADALPAEVVTLAEAMGEAGWYTAGFVTNYNVAPFFAFDQGFDEYHYLEPDFVLGADDHAAKLLLVQALRQRIESMLAARPGRAYQDAETVNRELFAWLDRAPRDRPWLLFVGYMDPHDPYFVHPYNGEGYSRAANPRPRPEEAPRLRALYDGEITYWDEHFGRLLSELRRRGLYDETLVVVTSDHGEEFMDHGGYWHGTTLYDEQLRVPLLVKLPGNERGGTVVRDWRQSIDVMPTLLARMGIAIPEGVQGRDLFAPGPGPDVYAYERHEGNEIESLRTRRGSSELKIIVANPGNPRGLPPAELFRVDQDPGERVDLLAEQPEVTELVTERLATAGRVARSGAATATQVDVGEADAERLRALGYAN